jgi:putative ABC transport system permease protein
MFLRFTLRALAYRKQRLFLAFAALAVAATLATVLFGIYGSVEKRIRDEFRAYGANIAASPATGETIPLALAAAAEKLGAEAAPFLTTTVTVNGRVIPVIGFIPAKTAPLTSYWHVTGSRDLSADECLAGEIVANELDLKPGSHLAYEGGACAVKGIVATGGPEDSELLIPFDAAAARAAQQDVASSIAIRAPGERLEAVRSALAAQFPKADVRTVQAVAGTESNVVVKLRSALFLLSILILAITALCVSSNFSEMVMERAKEIGILKALGAAERRIAAFFLSESAALGGLAALIGYALGILAAALISQKIFGGVFRLQPDPLVFLAVFAVMLAVSIVATSLAVSRIRSIEPAIILRGE